MILDDISDDAILIKVAASALCAKVFTENDLHIPDEGSAPQRLEHQVSEAQHLHKPCQQVDTAVVGTKNLVSMYVGQKAQYDHNIIVPIQYSMLERGRCTAEG